MELHQRIDARSAGALDKARGNQNASVGRSNYRRAAHDCCRARSHYSRCICHTCTCCLPTYSCKAPHSRRATAHVTRRLLPSVRIHCAIFGPRVGCTVIIYVIILVTPLKVTKLQSRPTPNRSSWLPLPQGADTLQLFQALPMS